MNTSLACQNNITDLIDKGSALLKSNGIECFLDEAYYFLSHASEISVQNLLENPDFTLDMKKTLLYLNFLQKRAAKTPRQYITGKETFNGIEILVGPGVFIPRPETAFFARIAVSYLKGIKGSIIDCYSGSGALSLYLSKNLPGAVFFSIEISEEAVKWQKKNLSLNREFSQNIFLIRSDALKSVSSKNNIMAVIANPPYIPSSYLQSLEEEVIRNEPILALDGGHDGLVPFRELSKQAHRILPKGGFLFSEIGCCQSDSASEILREEGFASVWSERDLSGIERVIVAVK
ncbi:peptide chain release factor N(5)-glutamine methyltransferase [candidate division WOR-3 bacterium]|nr:peptide chain release factor N(5)-glutamine methyltransferase [candidate division WOR-3 bacterium]